LRRIEKLYTRRIPPHEIVTQEFARQLTELSHETRRQIGALIDRKGHVEYVMVGDNHRIELPDFKRVRVAEGRFRGLRFVHTHLRGEDLTQDDLTDLALLRLDLMAAIDVDPQTGLPGLLRAAHMLPISRSPERVRATKAPTLFQPVSPAQLGPRISALINSFQKKR
jgi:GTP-binding protein HflX